MSFGATVSAVRREPMPAGCGLPLPFVLRVGDPVRVGLLGGSFNPAHAGHRYVSLRAMHRLGLDQVWWLVSPQNPLKPRDGMAPLSQRLQLAKPVARHPRIRVTDLERRIGTAFTSDTLRALHARFPTIRFVWLMGADNFLQIHRWKRWQRIFATIPIAIYPREPYSQRALTGVAASRFRRQRVNQNRAKLLADMRPPVWTFLHGPPHPASASRLRTRQAVGCLPSPGNACNTTTLQGDNHYTSLPVPCPELGGHPTVRAHVAGQRQG
jgi:nicotinate-nucleotide adenylyltransferase